VKRRKQAKPELDGYDEFVLHPRFGRGPRVTGLHPTKPKDMCPATLVRFHWHSVKKILNTAVVADCSKQAFTVLPVTHYFDVPRVCRVCRRPFLFFALEQKHWYEELGFPLDADCLHCLPCRKLEQGLARSRHRYEELFHIEARSAGESLEMAECCMSLIEGKQFSARQIERVRMLLNVTASTVKPTEQVRRDDLLLRIKKFAPR
jgi:Probable zinc-ribbon domain